MKDEVIMYSGDGLLAVFTALQVDEIMKWISLALTILTTVITLAFTIYKWWKKANEDGHVSSDEIQELIDEISKTKQDTEELIDKVTKEDKKDDQ